MLKHSWDLLGSLTIISIILTKRAQHLQLGGSPLYRVNYSAFVAGWQLGSRCADQLSQRTFLFASTWERWPRMAARVEGIRLVDLYDDVCSTVQEWCPAWVMSLRVGCQSDDIYQIKLLLDLRRIGVNCEIIIRSTQRGAMLVIISLIPVCLSQKWTASVTAIMNSLWNGVSSSHGLISKAQVMLKMGLSFE